MTEVGGPQRGSNLAVSYFRKLWEIHVRPRRFFAALPLSGGTAAPLAFALVTHWIASAVGYLSRTAMSELWMSASRRFAELGGGAGEAEIYSFRSSQQLKDFTAGLSQWLWSAGSVIADPFFTLIRLLVSSTVIWVGARILINPIAENGARREITWESILRITSYAMAASILSVIPIAGFGLAQLGVLILSVIGIQEGFRVSTLRALAVAIFPTLLIAGLLLVGLLFFSVLIFQIFRAML